MRTALALGLVLASTGFPKSVSFKAADGMRVYGEYYPANGTDKPLILLLHQAESNHAEYSDIAPKLVLLGFSALALDQRSGGRMWGEHNQTSSQFRNKPSYLDALKDIDAAIAWAKSSGHASKFILWGSSYSASLVFLVAARHPTTDLPTDVEAILAFSPGEYFDAPDTLQKAAEKVTCPVFITSAKDPKEIEAAKKVFDAVPSKNKTLFEPGIAGVHGSSTLRADKNPTGADENWKAVNQFLAQFTKP